MPFQAGIGGPIAKVEVASGPCYWRSPKGKTMPATTEDLFARFTELGIETTTHHHPPLFTVEDKGGCLLGSGFSLFWTTPATCGPGDNPFGTRLSPMS